MLARILTVLVLAMAGFTSAWSQVSVWTAQYDQGRTSANLNETILNASNVNTSQFGLLFTRAVDDYIYAQPLYLPQITIAGSPHNVVYVATINNSVYAFDGDSPALSSPLWQVNLGPAAKITTVKVLPHCGILSTPVIDQSTGTMYVVAMTQPGTSIVFSLHALDVTSGAEKFGGPVVIRASVKGTGSGSKNGRIAFSSGFELQRQALLLMNGTVYFGFARLKPETVYPYHGWELGYNAATLKQVFALNTTANGNAAGIWMSGRGPAADTSGFTLMTGNGDVGNGNIGESFARIGLSGTLYGLFTPSDWPTLNTDDLDLGAGGPLLIPATTMVAGGGKNGVLYLLDITGSGSLQTVQSFRATPGCSTAGCAEIHSPAFWNQTGTNPPLLYLWAANDTLKAFSFAGGLLSTTPAYQNPLTASLPGGGALAVSANGGTAGSAILWAAMSTQDASDAAVPGILHAFDASNVATELWNSTMNPADQFGNLAKFVVPTVANGKVYMATFSNQVAVYGLR
jgi:hypothetical protein